MKCQLEFLSDINFMANSFYFPGFAKVRKLKPGAVPSCNLPESSVPKRRINKNQDRERHLRRQNRAISVSVNPNPKNVTLEVPDLEVESNIARSFDSNLVSGPLNLESVERMKENLFKLAGNTIVNVRGEPLDLNTVMGVHHTVENCVTSVSENLNSVSENLYNYSDVEMQVPIEVDGTATTERHKCTTGSQTSVATCDIGIQVSSIPFIDALRTDEHLSTATGIESFENLRNIVELTKKVVKPDNRCRKLTLTEKIIMTYIKLKQNCSYAFLELLFNHTITRVSCKTIFFDTIQLLSAVLKRAISWPDRDDISGNMPKCFAGFEDVAVVLDCTEIFIQNPSSLTNQVITYSTYKGHATWKIMTGVSPAGDITYLSPVYGGRVSDKSIFEQCDIVKFLKPGDAIMVDKGFLIDKICDVNRWKLIRPPFLKDKKQLSKTEAELTSRIASARVHVERSNQRLKVFKVVGEKMSACLLPVVEDIFTVICATVNLGAPILKDDKFFT